MFSHEKILDIAREHLATIDGTLRCWAVELHGGKQTLMSYWRGASNRVEARAVYIDHEGGIDLELIAGHLNETNGSGPALLGALRGLYQGEVMAAESRINLACIHKGASRSLN